MLTINTSGAIPRSQISPPGMTDGKLPFDPPKFQIDIRSQSTGFNDRCHISTSVEILDWYDNFDAELKFDS